MKSIEAKSPVHLKRLAKSLTIDVRPRGEGRNKEQTEAWSARSLLLALADTDHIKYPVKVEISDKPDLKIFFNRENVGVEITEAVPEDYARVVVLAKRKYPDAIVDRSMFTWDNPRKSNAELHKILEESRNKLIGPAWERDSVEREWARGMFDTICVKLERINKKEYRMFPRYWLLIYDNLCGPMLNLHQAVNYLRERFSNLQRKKREFQYIFIEVNRTMVAISKGGQLRYYEFSL